MYEDGIYMLEIRKRNLSNISFYSFLFFLLSFFLIPLYFWIGSAQASDYSEQALNQNISLEQQFFNTDFNSYDFNSFEDSQSPQESAEIESLSVEFSSIDNTAISSSDSLNTLDISQANSSSYQIEKTLAIG